MDKLKNILLSQLLASKNTATISEDSRQVLKLKSGTQLAYRMCEKTLAVKMRQAELRDFEVSPDTPRLTKNEIDSAHFDMAYFDL